MYKFFKAYELGNYEGIKSALEDYYNSKIKKFKNIDDEEVLSKLYDIGYINGYNKFIKYINSSFNYKKNSV